MATATVLPDDPTKVFGRRAGAAVLDGALVLVPFVVVVTQEMESADLDTRVDLGMIRDADDFCDEYIDRYDGICVNVDDTVFYSEPGPAPFFTLVGLAILFYVLLQGLTGWTIGKLLFKLRVVREDGGKPGLGRAFVRWFLWIVDSLPFVWLVGIITSLTTVGHRRVGDMVAKTYVVDSRAAGAPIRLPGAPGALDAAEAPAPPGAPLVRPAPDPQASSHPQPTAKPGPQWDEQRKTYIQWDPELRLWMQWDEPTSTWTPIPNQ
jgi:hypothetical protein